MDDKVKVERTGTTSYYACEYLGKSYTVTNMYDDNSDSDTYEVIDGNGAEVSKNIQAILIKAVNRSGL